MNRAAWLVERRAAVEKSYTLEAPTYDEGYDPATPEHLRFVTRLVDTCPPAGAVLDAACGTGTYTGLVLAAGRRFVGVDQSSGMLAQARSRHPAARFERIGLQELEFDRDFDAAICIDAMENVPPEDWPRVLANLRQAVRAGGYVYLSVEEIDGKEITSAWHEATAAGLPCVFGEVVAGDTAGYHFYPDRGRVQGWLTEAGFEAVDAADEWLDGYGYHHLLVRAPD